MAGYGELSPSEKCLDAWDEFRSSLNAVQISKTRYGSGELPEYILKEIKKKNKIRGLWLRYRVDGLRKEMHRRQRVIRRLLNAHRKSLLHWRTSTPVLPDSCVT